MKSENYKKSVVETLPQAVDHRSGKAREQAGKLFNVSGRSIGDAQAIQKHGTEEQKQAVISGNTSVSKVAGEIRERKKAQPQPAEKAQFNRTNDNIEWALWTWNPVTGCENDCPYCYARDIANRFFEHKFEPHFYPERLMAPANTKPKSGEPNNVFVCSMADLFGPWVPAEWIQQVLDAVRDNPQWNFLFLTKNPARYLDFNLPGNCWLGATADTQERADEAARVFWMLKGYDDEIDPIDNITFLSCEPLLEHIAIGEDDRNVFSDDDRNSLHVDWLIIGGQSKTTGAPGKQPEWSWVASLVVQAEKCDVPYYFKPNLTVRPKEYPN